MKNKKQIINQSIVLSLLMVYVIVISLFIAYLPQVNNNDKLASTVKTELFSRNSTSGNMSMVLKRGIKSFIENKRKTLVPETTAFILAFFLIFGGVVLSGSNLKNRYYIGVRHNTHSYLSLRTLRI